MPLDTSDGSPRSHTHGTAWHAWVFSAFVTSVVLLLCQRVPQLAPVVWITPLVCGVFLPRYVSGIGFAFGTALAIAFMSYGRPLEGRDVLAMAMMSIAIGLIAWTSRKVGNLLSRQS